MLPLSDGVPARRFPVVNVALIAANFAVWIVYELPHLDAAVYHASFYPCSVDGASGAIAAVLGAYFVLYPGSKVTTWVFPVYVLRIPAWAYLGLWFLYQLIEADFGLFRVSANGGGVAFFAHVGGFIFGVLATWLLTSTRRNAGRP